MSSPKRLRLDEIGYWSEVKLDIIRRYASAYSTILSAQTSPPFHHVYIDAFAGAGQHVLKDSGATVEGSPLIAVTTQPPFKEYHFIDLNEVKVDNLKTLLAGYPNVTIYHGDCNRVLLDKVFPQVQFSDYRRGLCLLDPYGLHLNWEVIRMAGESKTLDVFLNFPIADMNRNVFWRNPDGVDVRDVARMDAFWGDQSWRSVAYTKVPTLFGDEDEKTDNEYIAAAFRERLMKKAGFANVPEPIPMRNRTGAIVYYLFFASPRPVAQKIVSEIFDTYRNCGGK